jgi:hypothetical protein
VTLNKYIIAFVVGSTAVLSASFTQAVQSAQITVQVDQPGHAIAPTLWGIFFEDINLSADGGIYPELVRNRSFEDSERPDSWTLVNQDDGKSEMSIDSSRPLNPFNRRSLRVRLDGAASIGNSGFWGMNLVKGEGYHVRVAARAADGFKGPVSLQLESKSGKELAKGEIPGLTEQWKYYNLDLTASDTDPKAQLSIRASGKGSL